MCDDRSSQQEPLARKFGGAYANAHDIHLALRTFGLEQRPAILIASKRPELFDADDLFDPKFDIGSVTFVSSHESLCQIDRKFDLAVVFQHAWNEYKFNFLIRARELAPLIAIWAWDNHHQEHMNLQSNALADVVFPSHAWCASTLNSPYQIMGHHLPLCCSQWSRRFLSEQIARRLRVERRSELSGGFVLWGTERDRLIRELADGLPQNAFRMMSITNRNAYFGLSAEDRLESWTRFKVGLCLALTNDVSQRIFDSLMTGQIPIVPLSTLDLDGVVSRELQDQLPIIRVGEVTVDNIRLAWQTALKRFDDEGPEGVMRRHKYALENHHISTRIGEMTRFLREIASKDLEWRCTDKGVGLFPSERNAAKPTPRYPLLRMWPFMRGQSARPQRF